MSTKLLSDLLCVRSFKAPCAGLCWNCRKTFRSPVSNACLVFFLGKQGFPGELILHSRNALGAAFTVDNSRWQGCQT